MPKKPVAPNLDALLPSWQLSLRADRKSETTLKTYADGVRFYLEWCAGQQVAPLERGSIRGWIAALLDKGNQPATARARQLAVRRFTSWLAEEGEIPTDPFIGIKAPKLDTKVIEPLTDGGSSGRLRDAGTARVCPIAARVPTTHRTEFGEDGHVAPGRGNPAPHAGDRSAGGRDSCPGTG